jgi:hypothetical protein
MPPPDPRRRVERQVRFHRGVVRAHALHDEAQRPTLDDAWLPAGAEIAAAVRERLGVAAAS